ncbi:TIGR03086 family metal-binding protein [Hoyosella subflava]|uniref:Mycothiol-dependent maleylpyruvate isomerase metal-binding domain-containing protein n=1 Tax=Hoyosella subflava (strain DSM 45089 / JCM 17490 / NBRC 109087 / DQS3-9A1) TaxID=443218 RepID=F6ELT4_HOYSD|nr:TIGR03086 family metal-binding protein [Hoyosella subflava]AEF41532.1 hypothetical protein AS9A_3087 [Hoyosella subflava DQS3-9A1]
MRYDLTAAAQEIERLLPAISDADLARPTPCEDYSVATLLAHIDGLAYAFHLAAPVTPKSPEAVALLKSPPAPSADDLPAEWRVTIPARLRALAETWRNPSAWDGETTIGGVTMPAEITGLVALDELVLHGWDLARATGQEFYCDDASTAACLSFTEMSAAPGEEAEREGLFGPVIDVPSDAPALDRAIGLSGRSPHWQP